jgi:hypothetical protein
MAHQSQSVNVWRRPAALFFGLASIIPFFLVGQVLTPTAIPTTTPTATRTATPTTTSTVAQTPTTATVAPTVTPNRAVETAPPGSIFTLVGTLAPVVGTLVSVAVGALITYSIALRREKVEEKRESQKRAMELRAAARLIDEELSWGEVAAATCIKKRSWWDSSVELSREAWKENKRVLAIELSSAAWTAVRVGVVAVADLALFRSEVGQIPSLNESVAEKIKPILRDISAAREALRQLAYGELPK